MANINGSDPSPAPGEDPDRTQRLPATQEVVLQWFSDDPTTTTAEHDGGLLLMTRSEDDDTVLSDEQVAEDEELIARIRAALGDDGLG